MLSSRGTYNRDVLSQVLNENGFDAEYLLEWGMPSSWEEIYWDSADHVLKLTTYFEVMYGICDSRDSLHGI
jgi:hypothetical protein